jgi:AAA domain-containing protein
MGSDPGSPRHASAPPSGRRLDSWKEIAEYLRRGITTVQRWEREEALPVRRHLHSSSGSVFPSADDIDAWLVGRSPEPTTPRREATTETASAPAQSVAVPGCAMPLDSPYYLRRPADDEFHRAVARRPSIVLVKGPRQVGKSSLLAQALHQGKTGERVGRLHRYSGSWLRGFAIGGHLLSGARAQPVRGFAKGCNVRFRGTAA